MQVHCKWILKFKGGIKIWSGRRDSNPRLQPWQGASVPMSFDLSLCLYKKIVAQFRFL